MNHKKAFFVILFALLFSLSVFASTYTISGYRFEIDGKTKDDTVRSLIVSNYTESFSSEEELKKALDYKRQVLINARLFFEDEIFYNYDIQNAGGGNYNVFVSFTMTDAKSTLLLPYPKYDSNQGLVLGLRYKDKNFMGLGKSLSVVFDAEQNDNSYSKGNYYVEVPFEDIRIGKIDFSGSLESTLNLKDKVNDYVAVNIKESNLSVGDLVIPSNVLLDFNFYTGKFRQLGYGISVNEIRLGDTARLDVANDMLLSWKDIEDTFLSGQIKFKDMSIKNARLSNRSYIKFDAKTSSVSDGFKRYQIENEFDLKFTGKNERWFFNSLFTHYNDYDKHLGDYCETDSAVSYALTDALSGALTFKTKWYSVGGFYSVIPGERLTINSKIANEIPFVFSIGEHNEYLFDKERIDAYFSTVLSSNYGVINYCGNFRKGTQFSVFSCFDFHPWQENRKDKTEYKFNVSLTTFPFALKHINPSIRLTLLASSKENYWKDDSSWRLDEDDVQSLFRGIQTDSKYVKSAYDRGKLVAAMNLNLVTSLFEFEDFGKTYVNLFVDTGIVRADGIDNKKDYKWMTGAGFEVIAILDSHPSYPIRISFGVDTDTFKDKFIKEKDGAKLSYEIFAGLGWMY